MHSVPELALVKILFVDDELNVLKALRRLFIDEDRYEVFIAESANEGLKILEREEGVCVIVSDYRMPEMNGVEFLRTVHERWPQTMRIVLSGYADTASVVEAINIGHIYKFVPKPWNDDELKVNIHNAVETWSLDQKNKNLSAELAQRNKELAKLNRGLEQIIQERTQALELRTQVLQLSQDVLDSLPVAVLGIDGEDTIVQVNSYANKLLAVQGLLLGEKASTILSNKLLEFLERVKAEGDLQETVSFSAELFMVAGCYLSDDRIRGVILTLVPQHGK